MVSKDGARWRRVLDALQPTINGSDNDHGADCDGTVGLLPGVGPVATYGPGCGFPCGPGHKSTAPFCGPAQVGLAVAADPADPDLVEWSKLPPLTFASGSRPCDAANPPGRLWKSATGKRWNMICGAGPGTAADPYGRHARGPWALYTTPAVDGSGATIKIPHGPWAVTQPEFAAGIEGGTGGPLFWPLPDSRRGGPTHVLSAGGGGHFVVGVLDPLTDNFTLRPGPIINTDHGSAAFSAAGLAEDGRVVFASWVPAGTAKMPPPHGPPFDPRCPAVGGISICGTQVVSTVRTLSWEPSTSTLLAYPISELMLLRNVSLYRNPAMALPVTGAELALPLPTGSNAAASDVRVNFTLPRAVGCVLKIRVFGAAGPILPLNVSKPMPSGVRTVWLFGGAIEVLPTEHTLVVRVLVDRSVVEWFVQGGRAVKTQRWYPPAGADGIAVAGQSTGTAGPAIVASVTVDEMGCGWEG